MKKLLVTLAIVLTFAGCGTVSTESKTNNSYTYYYAYISMPDGTIVEGNVETVRGHISGMVKVVIDGVEYITSSENVVLVRK